MTDLSVTVITPCFNGGRFLRATIESVLAQSQLPLEVLVVDDGSTDDSATLAESFGAPVRVLRQSNQGESIARNVGIAEARGTHLLFLDADDLIHPDALCSLSSIVGDSGFLVARMGCATFHGDPEGPFLVSAATQTAFFPNIISGNFGPPHTWLVPTSIARQVGGFRSDLQIFEDWEFWCRVGFTGVEIRNSELVGAFYRRHPNSQLAEMRKELTARGHVCVLEALVAGMLSRPAMIEQYGEELFWQLWVALNRARSIGVSWRELAALSRALTVVASRGPHSVRGSRYARMIRVLGVRPSETLRSIFQGTAIDQVANT